MPKLQCPSCGALVPSREGWAKASLSALIPAPSVPAMATQLRCPQCQSIFTQLQGGQLGTWRGLLPIAVLLGALLAVVALLPG